MLKWMTIGAEKSRQRFGLRGALSPSLKAPSVRTSTKQRQAPQPLGGVSLTIPDASPPQSMWSENLPLAQSHTPNKAKPFVATVSAHCKHDPFLIPLRTGLPHDHVNDVVFLFLPDKPHVRAASLLQLPF